MRVVIIGMERLGEGLFFPADKIGFGAIKVGKGQVELLCDLQRDGGLNSFVHHA